MKCQKGNIVNILINKDDEAQRADVSLDDVDQILKQFTERFEKDIANSDIEKYIDKYAIDSPFDEIGDTKASNKMSRRNIIRSTAKTKWDLIDLDTFSPKYMIALDKVLDSNKITESTDPGISSDDEIMIWNVVDEEWKNRAKQIINGENEIKIETSKEVYDTVKRSYAIQGLKKKMPWMSSCKTTAKMVSDRFKKGRRKESLRTAVIQEETIVEEVQPEPPSWEEMEKMRTKCIDWLEKHDKLPKI